MSRYVPLLISGKVVAYGSDAQVQDLRDRLRARGIDATVPALCPVCHGYRGLKGAVELTCDECWECDERWECAEDYTIEAERRGGAEPE